MQDDQMISTLVSDSLTHLRSHSRSDAYTHIHTTVDDQ